MGKHIDLTGKRYGRLEAKEFLGTKNNMIFLRAVAGDKLNISIAPNKINTQHIILEPNTSKHNTKRYIKKSCIRCNAGVFFSICHENGI